MARAGNARSESSADKRSGDAANDEIRQQYWIDSAMGQMQATADEREAEPEREIRAHDARYVERGETEKSERAQCACP